MKSSPSTRAEGRIDGKSRPLLSSNEAAVSNITRQRASCQFNFATTLLPCFLGLVRWGPE